jgi:hypothetical protein
MQPLRFQPSDALKACLLSVNQRIEDQTAAYESERAAIVAGIKKWEGIEAELIRRQEVLQSQAASSDQAANDLTNTLTRLAAVRQSLADARNKLEHLQSPTLAFAAPLGGIIYSEYAEQLTARMGECLEAFAISPNHARAFLQQSGAVMAVISLRDFPYFHEATPARIAQLSSFYARILRVQLDISRDEPTEQAAAETHDQV